MKKAIIILSAVFLLSACERGEVKSPSLDVSLSSPVVNAGTPVDFHLSGDCDMIAFYSGEMGNEYAQHKEDRILETRMNVSYSTILTRGMNPSYMPLRYSNDLTATGENGAFTAADVEAATWVDFSDRFRQPEKPQESVHVPAGSVDITDFFKDAETPMYLSFYYHVDPAMEGDWVRSYVNIQNFLISGLTAIGEDIVYSYADCNWVALYDADTYADSGSSLPNVNTSRLLGRCAEVKTEKKAWFVAGPFYKQANVNMGPDMSVAIKANSDPMPGLYQHTFDKPGKYTVTFVGINASIYGREEVVRSVEVTVVENGGSIVPPSAGEWND